ncbi:MAG TPA: ABC transporter ATP-binding protein [Burkholderiales bacterium]
MIELSDVAVRFGGQTLYEGLSFRVRDGEFLCILGPSGCGKSTTLRVIGGLLAAASGTVRVDGRPAAEAWEEIAYVFQSPRLVPWRDALGNVVLAMQLRWGAGGKGGGGKEAMRERARELLELVGLGADAHKYPRMLSGGERQRVAIARALAVEPRIILMDEPFAALDVATRKRMREEIVAIWQRTRKTVVFVTHDVDEALALADRVLLFSSKPSRILETLSIASPRPRAPERDPELARHRARLHSLFTEVETSGDAPARVA